MSEIGGICKECTLSGECGSCVESLDPVKERGEGSSNPLKGGRGKKIRSKLRKERWITRNDRVTVDNSDSKEVMMTTEGDEALEDLPNDKENCRLSDNLADCCRTVCLVCGLSFTLTSMRSHTISKHRMQITSYKEKFGPFQIIEKVFHKCRLCGKKVLLDNDTLGGHVKRTHRVKEKDYKERYMINETRLVNHGSSSKIGNQSTPFKDLQNTSPLSPPRSPLSQPPSLRRSSRKAKSRRESKLHLLPVQYSSDGSEGSLSDLEDMLTRDVLEFPGQEYSDEADIILIDTVDHNNYEVDLVFETVSADDELSVDEEDCVKEPKMRKKWKKKTDLKMSPRRAILMKQTEIKLIQEKVIPPMDNFKNKSQAKPGLIPLAERLVFHGRNFIPLELEDVEQELDCDFAWISIYTRKLLNDITDVNEAEKTLMIMWNEHVVKYPGLGKVNLRRLLLDFVDFHFYLIADLKLYCNFVCHMIAMQQAGLFTMETMVDIVMHMQELMNNRDQTHNSQASLHSVAALDAIFPSLELSPSSGTSEKCNNEDSCEEDDLVYSNSDSINISLEEASESLQEEKEDLSVHLLKKMEKCSIK